MFTPNDQFFVRWHWAVIPTDIDVDNSASPCAAMSTSRCRCRSTDIHGLAAVSRSPRSINARAIRAAFSSRACRAGNGRNGAMGNARWTGVRLKDVLDQAGVKAGAVQVRFNGLDEPVVADAPDFMKSLDIDHARDGEVMIAYAMNGEQLPLLNGFPLRLVVPGWYATYWVKMLNDIEVLDQPDTNFWMKDGLYHSRHAARQHEARQSGVKMVPINRMVPRSFVTNLMRRPDIERRRARDVARHRVRRRLRRGKRRPSDRRRQDLATRRSSARTKANMASGSGRRNSRPPPGTTRCLVRCTNSNGVVATRHAKLESGRLHAQRHRIDRYHCGLTE